ncbi:hypothetical protein N336_04945, partial [Phalacrocorax carbo]
GSTQIVELAAAVRAFELFSRGPLNIVADSTYVAGIIQRLESAFIQEVDNKPLFDLLLKLVQLLKVRQHFYFVVHIRSHTNLPGPLAEGNATADRFTMAAVSPQCFEQAKLAHEFFNQNAHSLWKHFSLTTEQIQDIIQAHPDCQQLSPLPVLPGTNPRGLNANDLWQSDVTHVSSSGRLKYVHVSIDAFSVFLMATAHSGDRAWDVVKHCLRCFATMVVPWEIKTDNGPTYVSRRFLLFFQDWGIERITGIPCFPTGQVIIECAHHSLKSLIDKQ